MRGLDDPAMLRVVGSDERGSWGILARRCFDGWVDPDGVRQMGGLRPAADEALGMPSIGGSEHAVALSLWRALSMTLRHRG